MPQDPQQSLTEVPHAGAVAGSGRQASSARGVQAAGALLFLRGVNAATAGLGPFSAARQSRIGHYSPVAVAYQEAYSPSPTVAASLLSPCKVDLLGIVLLYLTLNKSPNLM